MLKGLPHANHIVFLSNEDYVRREAAAGLNLRQAYERNETNFKNTIMFNQLDHIVAESADRRDRILAIFRANGVTSLSGKRIEDLVTVAP